MKFTVGIFGRDKFAHVVCFEDLAHALTIALRKAGHEISDFDNPGRVIALGVNNTSDPWDKIPKDMIIFNTEQVGAVEDPRFHMRNLDQYKKHVIWDYSAQNVQKLRDAGCKRAVHCPVGYVEGMRKVEPLNSKEEDIDVLFYGALNDRRKDIIIALENSGLKVTTLFNVYGKSRDDFIARAKIVLNIHFYEPSVFEIVRVSHLLASGKCVVSESGSCDFDLEKFAGKATVCVPIDNIVDVCKQLVSDKEYRQDVAERGRAEFKKLDLVDFVRKAVEAS